MLDANNDSGLRKKRSCRLANGNLFTLLEAQRTKSRFMIEYPQIHQILQKLPLFCFVNLKQSKIHVENPLQARSQHQNTSNKNHYHTVIQRT